MSEIDPNLVLGLVGVGLVIGGGILTWIIKVERKLVKIETCNTGTEKRLGKLEKWAEAHDKVSADKVAQLERQQAEIDNLKRVFD